MENFINNIFYGKLLAKKGQTFNEPKIVAYIPNPTNNDYNSGYIERVFIQKVNDKNAAIIEVNKKNINVIQSTFYYNLVIINWKIKGTETEIKKANKKSIRTAHQQMPRLSLYLPNLLQFARIEEFGNLE